MIRVPRLGIVLLALVVLSLLPPAVGLAQRPLTAADIVLDAGDVGPDYVVALESERLESGVTVRTRALVRQSQLASTIEPDGIISAQSAAVVARNPSEAAEIFNRIAADVFKVFEEVPVPAVGDQTRGGLNWSDEPFFPAGRIVLFREDSTVGWVLLNSFEPPTQMDDVVALAEKMAARARR